MLAESTPVAENLPAIEDAGAGPSTGPRRESTESVSSGGKKRKREADKSLNSGSQKKTKKRAGSSGDEFITPRKEPVAKKIVSKSPGVRKTHERELAEDFADSSRREIEDLTEVPTRPVSPVVLLQKDPVLDAVALALKAKQRADDEWIPSDQPDLDFTPRESPIRTRFSTRVSTLGVLLNQQPGPSDLEALERTRRQLQQILSK